MEISAFDIHNFPVFDNGSVIRELEKPLALAPYKSANGWLVRKRYALKIP